MKIKFLMLVLLLVLTIGAVSASDDNMTSDDLAISNDLQIESSIDSDNEILGSNTIGTFKELTNQIKNTKENNTLKLTKDYKNTDVKEGIVISKSITIDGNGYTIDGNKKTRIFTVKAPNVVLKNIVFKNGFSNNGGAVYIDEYQTNNQINNCKFIKCYANPDGDSKYDEHGSYSYTQHGGAIYISNNCVNNQINGCEFINCGATSNGDSMYSQYCGAVYFGNDCDYNVINNSNFINCSAKKDGGAVIFTGKCNDNHITNSNFINCSAKEDGGAVLFSIECTNNQINNTTFINCTAKNSGAVSFAQGQMLNDGGHAYYKGCSNCIIQNCSFINCQAKNDGGAIRFYDDQRIYPPWDNQDTMESGGLIDNCSFVNCKAKNGGAIYLYNYYTKSNAYEVIEYFGSDNNIINKSIFTNCIADYGGAIYFGFDSDYGTVNECDFMNCSATIGGSAYWNSSKGKIEKSRFQYSKAKNGGAVYADKNIDLTIIKCNFANNTATELGGAVYGGLTYNCSFSENSNPEIYKTDIKLDIEIPYCSLNKMPITIKNPRDTVGNFSIYIYNAAENYTIENLDIVNDTATFEYNCTKIGDYQVKAVLNTNYGVFESLTNITNSYIDIEYSYEYYLKKNYKTNICLPRDATGNLTLYVKFKDNAYKLYKSINLTNGSAVIYFNTATAGKYEFIATYQGNYGFENKTETITFKDGSVIYASNINVYYNDARKYSVEVYGVNNEPLAKNTIVTIKIGTKSLKGKANSKGLVTVSIPKFKPGKYTITVKYLNAKASAKLTVKHIVALKTVKVKKSAKKLVLQSTLKNKKALKGKTVTFKFNGKTYKAKTNSKGIAKVTIKSKVLKKLKVGKKIAYSATYLKDTVKKTAKVQR